MNIQETGGVQGPQPIQPTRQARAAKAFQASPASRSDAAEISLHAKLLEKLSRVPEVRQEKIDAIKQQIASGTYETDARLQAAVEKMIQELS